MVEHYSAEELQALFRQEREARRAKRNWVVWQARLKGPAPGNIVLDRVHQTMILFAGNRGELFKRFVAEDGVGKDACF